MKKNTLIFAFLFLFIGITTHAQQVTISGKVVAFKGFPINGAQVTSKKTDKAVVTNIKGEFTIKCNKKDVLKFSAEGFNEEAYKIKTNDSLSVNLIYQNEISSYNKVVDNLHLKAETLDHCLANLLQDNNNYDRLNSIFELVQLIYPGARVTREDNGGSEQIMLESRGPNTIMASPNALLVVDGIVVTDISSIRPTEVKTIKVLVGNDAAHWGVRGGNGAIEIELKKGGL